MSQPSPGAAGSPTVFLSYARADGPTVQIFARELRALGLKVLLDVEFLHPGESFESAIIDRVLSADALVFFISAASLQSNWVLRELLVFSRTKGQLILPVAIGGADYPNLPAVISDLHYLVVNDISEVPAAARRIAESLAWHRSGPAEQSPDLKRRAGELASNIAADIRTPAPDPATVNSSVFLVHGHDYEWRDEVDQFLKSLGIDSVILAKVSSGPRSLLDRFETLATKARFAVVLMSPDDLGASRRQYEDAAYGGERTLKFRARENVILELGFFYGRLGWENVFVVQKPAERAWPDFERPSDLAGAVFFGESDESEWRHGLRESLRSAGLLRLSQGSEG